ncbi:hypothetical protein GSI_12530 [Ganoderma sinense ZZ0214-1]|uniref:BTB domain-containing protein n=1 Tax=Ganoderma sinense ZZ0214-1 TaxID=1077348 RepID=A0A2G8RT07_9APHY|nr:hypothetical protein GSI_12530 [Ganoderma sinense ZZ0214-1]
MSESVSDATAPTIARHPFNQPSADITLRSSDRVDFYVYGPILSQVSPVFADMFSLPQPSSVSRAAIADRPVVDVTEDSRALERLLRLCYPIRKEKLEKLGDIVPVLHAAMKYDMEWPIYLLTTDLQEIVPRSPLKVWAVACRCGLEDLAQDAAAMIAENAKGDSDSGSRRKKPPRRRNNTTAQAPLTLLASMLQDPEYGKEVLRGISAGDYFRLREYLRTGDDRPTTNLLSPTTDSSTLPNDPSHESSSSLPTSLIPLFPPPDVILRCPDGLEFHVHTLSLVLLSPILAERVQTLISSSSEPQDEANAAGSRTSPSLEMDVDSSTLSIMLAIVYGGNAHLPSDLHALSSTLIAANKFGFAGIAEAAQDRWNILATSRPLDAYFIAIERGLADCARFAARKVLEGPIAAIYSRTMESSTALAYHYLLEYYQACASSINRRMEAAVAVWNGFLNNIQGGGSYYSSVVRLENAEELGMCLKRLAQKMSTDVPTSNGCSFDLTLPTLLRSSSTMWPSQLAPLYKEVTGVLTDISTDLPRLVADAITEVQLEIE